MQEDKKIEEYVIADNLGQEKNDNWKETLIGFLNGRYFVPVIIILISVIAFSLGRISGLQEKREAVRILNSLPNNSPPNPSLNLREGSPEQIKNTPPNPPYIKEGTENTASVISAGAVVASKNGTKYHYPWCAGAKQISEKNKIIFDSIESAKKAGYTPASNCKGLR